MKLTKHWRYRVWNLWADLGHMFTWTSIPYRVVRVKLWNWAHFENGEGKHLHLEKSSWNEVWRQEVNKHRFGEY